MNQLEKNKYLNKLKVIAEENNGKLLSTEWLGHDNFHSFEYADGRNFKATGQYIILKGWPQNLDSFLSNSLSKVKDKSEFINLMKKIAEENNGKLLSTEWVNAKHKYLFQFEDGRQFKREYWGIYKHGWPQDPDRYLRMSKRYSVIENGEKVVKYEEKYKLLLEKALENGGKLLSSEWLGRDVAHKFIDENGIEFESTPRNIFNDIWVPNKVYMSESIVKQAFEHIFSSEFKKSRDVLTAELLNRKHSLELDGYCKELKIAFEYQGHPSHWNTTHKSYNEVSAKDKLKKEYCKKLGIILVEVPPLYEHKDKWKSDYVLEFVLKAIIDHYKENKLSLPQVNDSGFTVNFKKIPDNQTGLIKMKLFAEKNGGKLISTEWLGTNTQHEFSYQDGREFKTSWLNLQRNGWPTNLDKFLSLSQARVKDHSAKAKKKI